MRQRQSYKRCRITKNDGPNNESNKAIITESTIKESHQGERMTSMQDDVVRSVLRGQRNWH